MPSPPSRIPALGGYIAALVGALGDADAAALGRMRVVVGGRRARIVLEGESVDVAFDAGGLLVVEPSSAGRRVDGVGITDRGTVLDMLDGHLEVTDAILGGRLQVTGAASDVIAMFTAIEILLDASPRSPDLQRLAREFHQDGPRPGRHRAPEPLDELALLARLGLVDDEPEAEHPCRDVDDPRPE